jgi:hypothetical protein
MQKPLNLLSAVGEIQHTAAMERSMTEPLNKNFLSVRQRLDFFVIGFKAALISGLFMALLTPFAVGVIEKMIPIFGDKNPSLFDEIYAFLLAVSFSLGYGIFLASLRSCYVGVVSKGMIKNLFSGLALGAILKFFIILLLFNYIYIALTPSRVYKMLLFVHKTFSHTDLQPAYNWILSFKQVFPVSVILVAIASFLLISIPTVTLAIYTYKNRKTKEQFDD